MEFVITECHDCEQHADVFKVDLKLNLFVNFSVDRNLHSLFITDVPPNFIGKASLYTMSNTDRSTVYLILDKLNGNVRNLNTQSLYHIEKREQCGGTKITVVCKE